MEKANSQIDSARRVLLGTSVGLIGTSPGANPGWYYQNFNIFRRFFGILPFSQAKGADLESTATPGIDRARRDLLGTSDGYIGTSSEANPEKKNSNSFIRHPTYINLVNAI